MGSQKYIIFMLISFLSKFDESCAQNPLQQNLLFKRPNYSFNEEPMFSDNQSENGYHSSYMRQPMSNPFMKNNPLLAGGAGVSGANPAITRGFPLGSYPPPNYMNYGQNGFGHQNGFGYPGPGFSGVANPYPQYPFSMNPYSLQNQLMPYFNHNMFTTFRGIPAYGFGYGIIGDSSQVVSSIPYRTSVANSDNNEIQSTNYKIMQKKN